MKRSIPTALMLGLIAGAVASVLHATGIIVRLERIITQTLLHNQGAATRGSEIWLYLITFVLGFTIAWLTLNSADRRRIGILVAILLIELFVAAWVCALYRVTFEPLPSMVAIVLAFSVAEGW